MPIPPYSDETYVAFLDVSGFKEMMKREAKAKMALNKFYTTIYNVSGNFRNLNSQDDLRARNLLEVDARVISDCAVLFSRNTNPAQDKVKGIRSILRFIQQVNHRLIDSQPSPPIMTTCSIAYGDFKYEDRIEFDNIRKNFFVGWPYVKAFLDNESGKPRIQPGQCRLMKENLNLMENLPADPPFSLLEETNKYYYFHWMLDNLDDLKQFKLEYRDTYQLKYTGMISVLQKYVRRTHM